MVGIIAEFETVIVVLLLDEFHVAVGEQQIPNILAPLLITALMIASSIPLFLSASIPFLNEPTPGRTKILDFEISSGSATSLVSAPRYLNALITDQTFPLP